MKILLKMLISVCFFLHYDENWAKQLTKSLMLQKWTRNYYSPQIFNGASSSNKIGWDRNISRDLRHSPRISPSVSWTFLPGRAPRTRK